MAYGATVDAWYCETDDCAWWCEASKQCSVKTLASSAIDISIELQTIRQRMP